MFDLEYYRFIKEYKTYGFSKAECEEHKKNRRSFGLKSNMTDAELRHDLKINNQAKNNICNKNAEMMKNEKIKLTNSETVVLKRMFTKKGMDSEFKKLELYKHIKKNII